METKLTTIPLEYGVVSETPQEQIITTKDQQCFDEIRQILQKHQAQNRFGITLINTEELLENQVRLETNSIKDRTLLSRILDKNLSSGRSVETNWSLNTMEAVATCKGTCAVNSAGGHTNEHGGGGQDIGQ